MMNMKLSLAQYVTYKSEGATNLVELMSVSNMSRSTLAGWLKDESKLAALDLLIDGMASRSK